MYWDDSAGHASPNWLSAEEAASPRSFLMSHRRFLKISMISITESELLAAIRLRRTVRSDGHVESQSVAASVTETADSSTTDSCTASGVWCWCCWKCFCVPLITHRVHIQSPPPFIMVVQDNGNSVVGTPCSDLCSSHGVRGTELNCNVVKSLGFCLISDHLEKHSFVKNGNLETKNGINNHIKFKCEVYTIRPIGRCLQTWTPCGLWLPLWIWICSIYFYGRWRMENCNGSGCEITELVIIEWHLYGITN